MCCKIHKKHREEYGIERFDYKTPYKNIENHCFFWSIDKCGFMDDIIDFLSKEYKGENIVMLILATSSRASIISGIALFAIWMLYKLPIRRIRYRIAFLLLAGGIGLFALSQHPRMQKFDYEQLLSYTLEDMTIKIVQTVNKLDSECDIVIIAFSIDNESSTYSNTTNKKSPYLNLAEKFA